MNPCERTLEELQTERDTLIALRANLDARMQTLEKQRRTADRLIVEINAQIDAASKAVA